MSKLDYTFTERPSVLAFMTRALTPTFLRGPLPFPPVRARWERLRPDPGRLRQFLSATGLERQAELPLTYLHALTFPLQMVILTAPALPLPIWRMLQVRNRLLQHQPVPADATLDVAVSVSGQRVLERGVELDLHLTVEHGAGVAWEALTTCYYRGRFGLPPAGRRAPPSPAIVAGEVASWRTPSSGGWGFGRTTGDYNGIHTWGAYARLFGFRGAFLHPHAVVGQCLARLPPQRSPAQRLDLWFKGPVYYGSAVRLAAAHEAGGLTFSLRDEREARPALVARWCESRPGESVLDDGPASEQAP